MSARHTALTFIAALATACSTEANPTQIPLPEASTGTCLANTHFAAIAWKQPHPAENACTDNEIDDFVSACLGGATPIKCEQFTAAHRQCASCIYPNNASAGSGAIIEGAGRVLPNVGGCIALSLGETSTSGCGAREHAARECVASVCSGCGDPNCETDSRKERCLDQQMQRCVELAGAAPCILDESTDAAVQRIAKRMCSNDGRE